MEFACGIPHLLKGEFTRQRRHRHRQLVAAPTARRVRGHHAVQLSRDGADVDVSARDRVRQHVRPEAVGARSVAARLRLAELLAEAGLPPGVFNVVNGDREAVDTLLTDPDVAAVSFVGSTPVAQHVYETAAQHGKRVQALGGAKNHMVVMPDADPQLAAQALMGAAYGSAGERCMAISVAVAVGDAADQLIAALRPMIDALRIGAGTRDGVEMGPLVTREHLRARARLHRRWACSEGATLVVDGRGHRGRPDTSRASFSALRCSITSSRDMRIYREEIFGPVLVDRARAGSRRRARSSSMRHEFGNGTAIFTRDGAQRAQVRAAGAGRDGRRQRADSGADGVPQLRRLEALAVRRSSRARPGRRALLHALKTVTARWPRGARGAIRVHDADDEVRPLQMPEQA